MRIDDMSTNEIKTLHIIASGGKARDVLPAGHALINASRRTGKRRRAVSKYVEVKKSTKYTIEAAITVVELACAAHSDKAEELLKELRSECLCQERRHRRAGNSIMGHNGYRGSVKLAADYFAARAVLLPQPFTNLKEMAELRRDIQLGMLLAGLIEERPMGGVYGMSFATILKSLAMIDYAKDIANND